MNHIVVDGYSRLFGDNEVQAEIQRCTSQIEERYAEELASASWFRQVVIRRHMRREVREAVGRIASPRSLY